VLHEQTVTDLEGRARPVCADRRGPHGPDRQIERHQLELEIAKGPRRDEHGRNVLVRSASHVSHANPAVTLSSAPSRYRGVLDAA
jgi:hypothetical protein